MSENNEKRKEKVEILVMELFLSRISFLMDAGNTLRWEFLKERFTRSKSKKIRFRPRKRASFQKKKYETTISTTLLTKKEKNKYLYLSQAVSPGDIIKAKNSQIQGSQTEAFNGKEGKCKSFS